MRRALLILVALPPTVLAIANLVMVLMAFAGAHPFWQWRPLTLSEAAAVRDAGEIGRLLELGNDPNARYPLRAGILYDEPSLLTPVQAARAAQRDEIVDLLVSAGARLEDDRADSNPADTR